MAKSETPEIKSSGQIYEEIRAGLQKEYDEGKITLAQFMKSLEKPWEEHMARTAEETPTDPEITTPPTVKDPKKEETPEDPEKVGEGDSLTE